ncbi:MAG: DUF5107 domain-containing protein [Clostridia bacterium]|nr:DUF5107 domain-containing protein [Clostridia bacterium]
MKNDLTKVSLKVEKVNIPTYDFLSPEEMPMFAETANHQGTTGNPYPVRATSGVDVVNKSDKPWTVVTLENEFIRVSVMPELGGRVCEAYDKVTGYDFLYRQHVVKPAMIGVYGPWTSGGLEFNWPFHHRPSTLMPLDFTTESCADGSAIVWLSEHSPCDRTKGMVGIVLRPGCSYFETRAAVTNRTENKHSFLWWENAAVAVHEDYRLVFPPDVTWVHHHNDAGHTTFPIAEGQYGADTISEPKDISWHKNSRLATSYFAGPSKYDFFGGYDYRRECGIIHVADHHVSPGKKMFTWGYGTNADTWEKKLTDTDGAYAELMAGCYTDDQPDFTWLAPYETKCFSQFWYPTQGIGYTTYANLAAAVALDREKNEVRFNVTSVYKSLRATVTAEDGEVLLDKTFDATPSSVIAFAAEIADKAHLTVKLTDNVGKAVFTYTEEDPDYVHIPNDRHGIPTPDELKTPTDILIAGQHLDQYRSPLFKPDEYYLEAIRREPDYLYAHKALGEYYTRVGRFSEALTYLERAYELECKYNQNPEDGSVNYLRGLCLKYLGRTDEAYDAFRRSAWSNNTVSAAMTQAAAIDGLRGEFELMYEHAKAALERDMRNPVALSYAALAKWKLGDTAEATAVCNLALGLDPLNRQIAFIKALITKRGRDAFFASLEANSAETALDMAYELMDAGFFDEAVILLRGALKLKPDYAMLHYTLALCYSKLGNERQASRERTQAKREKIVESFPIRAGERTVLEYALRCNPNDGFAAYLLGCYLYNARDYVAARELWEKAVRYEPKFYIPHRNLALIYYNHFGMAKEAAELLHRAIMLKPGDSILLSELSDVLMNLEFGNPSNAELLDENKPKTPTDRLVIAIATAYNSAFMFDKAEEIMRSHTFTPAEGEEFMIAEPYMYACLSRGRLAMKEKNYELALEYFRAATALPENLNVGFWNEVVLIPYKYNEAAALMALGRKTEARELINKLINLKNEGMWNMGGDFVYYFAESVRLGGEEVRAKRIMREATLGLEGELSGGCKYYRRVTSLFSCFTGDYTKLRLSELYGMLGYAKLFLGDTSGAVSYFEKSLSIAPSYKIGFELSLLK